MNRRPECQQASLFLSSLSLLGCIIVTTSSSVQAQQIPRASETTSQLPDAPSSSLVQQTETSPVVINVNGTASISGVVVDQSGAAVENARVTLVQDDGVTMRIIQSGARGEFTLENLATGVFRLTVTAKGFAFFSSEAITVAGGQSVFTTNLFSVVAVTREFLPLLKKSPAGRIVNLGSIVGSLTLQAMPQSPIAPFKAFACNASKTALNQFTVHLAAELQGTNIKVNSAHPGWVKTELGTQHAQMEIADGARTSVELALIDQEGPNGKFIHLGKELPW